MFSDDNCRSVISLHCKLLVRCVYVEHLAVHFITFVHKDTPAKSWSWLYWATCESDVSKCSKQYCTYYLLSLGAFWRSTVDI